MNKRMIACIGNNSGTSLFYRDLLLATGYENATDLLYNSICSGEGYIDVLVYPLFFNSRHSIELIYKVLVRLIEELYKLKNKIVEDSFTKNIEKDLLLTHSIISLYAFVKENIEKLDSRIKHIIDEAQLDNGENILDYSNLFDIDEVGDAFRYTFKKDGETEILKDKKHLDVFEHYTKYKKLKNYLEYLIYFFGDLYSEYMQGTFTTNLSRKLLRDISIELPDFIEWQNPSFKQIKESLMEKYNISSNELSKAINIIKEKRFLAVNIGLEIPFKDFSVFFVQKFNEIIQLVQEELDSSVPVTKLGKSNCTKETIDNRDKILSFIAHFTKEDKILFHTFIEVGMLSTKYYDEELENVYNYVSSMIDNWSDEYLYSKLRLVLRGDFKRGLEICGQKTIIEKLGL